jgi:hypothetical protein
MGHVLARADDSDNSASKGSEMSKLKGGKTKILRNKPQSGVGGSGFDSESHPKNKRKKSTPLVALQVEGDGTNVDESASPPIRESTKCVSSGEDGKASLREARSRRRQQIVKGEVQADGLLQAVASPPKKSRTNASDEVVKIPMLTGTLYLYRGAKRSVAFVRNV